MIATVRFSPSLGAADRERVITAARELGFSGEAQTSGTVFRGATTWIVEFVLAVPVTTFFGTLASEFGKDTYAALKKWLATLNPPPVSRVVIVDAEATGITLDLHVDESLRALPEVDWRSAAGGQLVWDADKKIWRQSDRG